MCIELEILANQSTGGWNFSIYSKIFLFLEDSRRKNCCLNQSQVKYDFLNIYKSECCADQGSSLSICQHILYNHALNLIITLCALLQKLSRSSEQSLYSFEWNWNFSAVHVKTSDRHLPSTENLLEILHFVMCTRINILHWIKYWLMTHIWPWYNFSTGFTYIKLWWKDKKKKA